MNIVAIKAASMSSVRQKRVVLSLRGIKKNRKNRMWGSGIKGGENGKKG